MVDSINKSVTICQYTGEMVLLINLDTYILPFDNSSQLSTSTSREFNQKVPDELIKSIITVLGVIHGIDGERTRRILNSNQALKDLFENALNKISNALIKLKDLQLHHVDLVELKDSEL